IGKLSIAVRASRTSIAPHHLGGSNVRKNVPQRIGAPPRFAFGAGQLRGSRPDSAAPPLADTLRDDVKASARALVIHEPAVRLQGLLAQALQDLDRDRRGQAVPHAFVDGIEVIAATAVAIELCASKPLGHTFLPPANASRPSTTAFPREMQLRNELGELVHE